MTIAAAIALLVGVVATAAPQLVLTSKGVTVVPATLVWVREVGVALLSIGGTAMALRHLPDSPALRVVLLGNAAHQVMLAPIEVVAYAQGTIPLLSGIVPNTALHCVLAAAFLSYGLRRPWPELTSGPGPDAAPRRP